MIQRIQTVYLAVAICILAFVTLGSELFTFTSETSRFVFSAYNIKEYSVAENVLIGTRLFPFFISTLLLIGLAFITLMSYKNLKQQFRLGRITFYLYSLLLVVVLLIAGFGSRLIDAPEATRELGLGFVLFVCGFPFTFLANTGIKRDKKLLESLDRLR